MNDSSWSPRTRFEAILIASLGVLALPSSAFAFQAQGQTWPNAESTKISYMVDPNGSDDAGGTTVVEAARSAFATWESVACSYLSFEEKTFVEASTSERNVIANDGNHRIYFAETAAEWPGDTSTLALTYTFYTLDATAAITDGDIVMNGVSWNWTTVDTEAGTGSPAKVDVETVLFHEIGHFFGLAHSTDTAAAMYPSNNKVLQRTPANDDVEGICALYSNGQPLPHNPEAGSGYPVGAACLAHSNCASSLCIEDTAYDETYCSQQCVSGTTSGCPSGYECVEYDSVGYCLKPAPVDEICDLCSLHEHCATGLCVAVANRNGNNAFCTKACDPTPGQASQCPEGYNCEITQQSTTQIAVCVPSSGVCQITGKGGHLEPCYGNLTCKSGHSCLEYWEGSGLTYCYADCNVGAVGYSCGTERSVCAQIATSQAICFEIARAGEPCVPEQCDSTSLCAYDETSGVDSATCYAVCPNGLDTECEANHDCVDAGLGVPVCVPLEGFRTLGQSCNGNAECESGLCGIIGSSQLCTKLCSSTEADPCGVGLTCVTPTGSTQGQCYPRSLTETDAGVSTPITSPTYCACDSTSQCDADCDCDPECGDGCRDVAPVGSDPRAALLGLMVLAGLLLFRPRVRRS